MLRALPFFLIFISWVSFSPFMRIFKRLAGFHYLLTFSLVRTERCISGASIQRPQVRVRLNGESNYDSHKVDKWLVIRVVTGLGGFARFPLSLSREALKLASGDEWEHYEAAGLGAVPLATQFLIIVNIKNNYNYLLSFMPLLHLGLWEVSNFFSHFHSYCEDGACHVV